MARRLQKTASLACAISSLDSQDSFLMQAPVSRSLSKENAQPVKSPLAAAAVPTLRGLNNRDPISSQFRRTEGQDGAWFLVWPPFPAWIPPLFVCLCVVSCLWAQREAELGLISSYKDTRAQHQGLTLATPLNRLPKCSMPTDSH